MDRISGKESPKAVDQLADGSKGIFGQEIASLCLRGIHEGLGREEIRINEARRCHAGEDAERERIPLKKRGLSWDGFGGDFERSISPVWQVFFISRDAWHALAGLIDIGEQVGGERQLYPLVKLGCSDGEMASGNHGRGFSEGLISNLCLSFLYLKF